LNRGTDLPLQRMEEGEMERSGHQSEMQLRGSESKGVVYRGRWMAGLLDSNEAGGNRI